MKYEIATEKKLLNLSHYGWHGFEMYMILFGVIVLVLVPC